MVETRNQEKTMLELVEEIRAGQENQTNEFRQRINSLDERYNKLERLVFEHVSQIQAQGKQQFNDTGGSLMMDPTSAESTRPLDPPNLQRFRQYTPDDRSTPPQNTLSNRLAKLTFPAFDVGESKGWRAKHGSYHEWAKRKEFQVGDSLMFEYDGNVNDVTQVSSRLEYQFCNSLSPKAVYNTGHDVVTLTEPGYHFFITSNHSQCVVGQKLVVFVAHDHPIPPPPPPRKILPFGKDFKVGDSNEWRRVPEESDFYSKWSEEKQFHVGDNLLFYYNDQVDDLLEINSDLEFKSCDTTSPVAVHNAGQNLIRLTKPGIRYFITSKIGHYEAGLKLRVVVRPLSKSVPKKMQLSPFDRLIKWLHDSFTPHPHH
ncbi:hypothetical protein Bca101_077348 [Brassica carinata]